MPCLRPHALAQVLLLLLGTLGSALALAAPLRITALDLPGRAQGSVIATDEGFLLSWIDREGPSAALRFAELDINGIVQRRGDVVRGEQWFINWADFPSLVVADNGDWLGYALVKSDPGKPYAYDILTTRSTDRGASWSAPAVLHDDGTTTEHGFVSLLPDGDDRILAVWLDGRRSGSAGSHDGHDHDGAHTALHSAVLRRDGIVERGELDALTCDCCRTSLARGTDGPVAVYRDRTRDEVRDIFEVARSTAGWGAPQPLPADHWTMPGCPVNGPALVAQGDALLAAWPTQVNGMPTLRLARREVGRWRPLAVLDQGKDMLGRVDLAPWTERSTLAVWLGGDDGDTVLKLAELDADGAPRSVQALDTLPRGRGTGMPRIAARHGRALVVWTAPGEGGPRLRAAMVQPGQASSTE